MSKYSEDFEEVPFCEAGKDMLPKEVTGFPEKSPEQFWVEQVQVAKVFADLERMGY